jgi:hypothetical protein
MEKHSRDFKHEFNRITPNEIVSRVMRDNALTFMERYYTSKKLTPAEA